MGGGESLASRSALFLLSFVFIHTGSYKPISNHWKEPYTKKTNGQVIYRRLPLKVAGPDTLFTVLASRV